MSSTPSQSVITHNHACFCGDTDECTQFAVLPTPCFFELVAAKVGVLFDCRFF